MELLIIRDRTAPIVGKPILIRFTIFCPNTNKIKEAIMLIIKIIV